MSPILPGSPSAAKSSLDLRVLLNDSIDAAAVGESVMLPQELVKISNVFAPNGRYLMQLLIAVLTALAEVGESRRLHLQLLDLVRAVGYDLLHANALLYDNPPRDFAIKIRNNKFKYTDLPDSIRSDIFSLACFLELFWLGTWTPFGFDDSHKLDVLSRTILLRYVRRNHPARWISVSGRGLPAEVTHFCLGGCQPRWRIEARPDG